MVKEDLTVFHSFRRHQQSRSSVLCLEELEPRLVLSSPSSAPLLGTPPDPGPGVVWVNTETDLQNAVANLQSGETIVIQRGTYDLTSGLYIGYNHQVTDVTIRGETDNFDDVVLRGRGMDNADFGSVGMGISIWNAQRVEIANLSVGDVYYHPIELKGEQGASAIDLYHDHFFNAGEQFVKSDPNPDGGGVDNSTVEYCVFEYLQNPPTTDHGGGIGYTNGVDVLDGSGWAIQNNLFQNFHTPDTADNLWNPVILIWHHSSDTTVEGNTFINTDRAIAFGLVEAASGHDNVGGTIRNNFIYMTPGLFSSWRVAGADAQIILWDSPGTTVYQNTVLTSGNTPRSIEVRFASTTDIDIANNLTDAPLGTRDDASYVDTANYVNATSDMFVDPGNGDLHLVSNSATQAYVIGMANTLAGAPKDWDGVSRPEGGVTEIGAAQYP
jgi:hypothetical protein